MGGLGHGNDDDQLAALGHKGELKRNFSPLFVLPYVLGK